jgi:TatD DNase family protein
MEIAAGRRKPIVIHCRPSANATDAWDDTLTMLHDKWSGTGLGGILHCFGGELRHAQEAIDLGFLISFAGNVTFPKAQPIRDAAVALPLDRMLIETDAPFLAPIPNRGKRNEPAWVKAVALTIAEIRKVDPEAVVQQTTSNFSAFFGTEIPSLPRLSGQ